MGVCHMNKKLNSYKANKVALTNTVIDKMATPVLTPRPNKRPRANINILWDTSIAGLHIRNSATGNKSWFYFYKTTINQHQRNYYIGKYPQILTKKAKAEAKRLAGEVASGGDPHIDRRSEIKQGTVTDWSEYYIKLLPMKKSRKQEVDIHRKYIQPNIYKMAACGGHFVGIGLYIFLVYFLPIFYIYFLGIFSKVPFRKYPFGAAGH